jgi:uncharacterized protein YlxP (DUF503 family)
VAVIVGSVEIEILIRESRSLKARRRVVKSLKDRIRGKFNVSVADVGDQGVWQRSVLGVAVVTNERRLANEVLSKVLDVVSGDPRVEIVSQRMSFD